MPLINPSFGIDMAAVRTRAEGMAYFLAVQDVLAASEALDETVPASSPALFIGTANERATPNQYVRQRPGIGGTAAVHQQSVDVELSLLFVEASSRFDGATLDQVELVRKALIAHFIGWMPPGCDVPLEYARYRVVDTSNGLAWGEVTFTTRYRVGV